MESTTQVFNSSKVTNGSGVVEEFPYWQPTLAIGLFSSILVQVGTALTLYLPLLVALVRQTNKNMQFRPLNLIHMSLLAFAIVDDILRTIMHTMYLPSIYRYCICSYIVGTIFAATETFFSVSRPISFACLGVLQLLIVLGKKKLAKIKTVCVMIVLVIVVSLIFIASIIRIVHESNERPICNVCFCPNYGSESSFSITARVLTSVTLASLVPSLIIIIVTSMWSCAIFKSYYTGGDDQLNRRMLSLPVIMPLAIIASNILEIIVTTLASRILLALSLGVYFPHWIVFTHLQLLIFLRFISRLVYPLVLVYTHTPLRNATKRLLKRLKGRNQVSPVTSTSSNNY